MIKSAYVLQIVCGCWLLLMGRGARETVMLWAIFACIVHALWVLLIDVELASVFELAFAAGTLCFFMRRDVRNAMNGRIGQHAESYIRSE